MNDYALSASLRIVILIFSVILHEVMHGLVALKFGDRTAQKAGRLTLNPLPHIDPVGTILVPALLLFSQSGFLLGWAKPVPVNPLNFSNIRRGELFVSAAGILSNFALAIVAAILFHLVKNLSLSEVLVDALTYTVIINLLLGIFNLLPIPPLDGSKMLLSQLSYRFAKEYQKIEAYGFMLLLVLLFSGMLQFVYVMVVRIARILLGF
ncbi:site-2 protease family protein [Candidatus Daviesbacteria bacterium]|nr:site-2 protease family protein [Candidatus Daviesbacteria bacterium]